jgi:hypothetical protein|tara:strand:+ start:293 stop:409 length:117 start_codon:yes stop_codon:yes gene_type:complete
VLVVALVALVLATPLLEVQIEQVDQEEQMFTLKDLELQ